MDFYLARHGEAVSETLDPERPLTAGGQQDVEEVARLAAARNVRVSAILHSGILRARQTAEIFAARLTPAMGVREISGLLPQDDPMIAKAELEAARESFLLVGHLPHMSRLAALLVHGDSDREVVDFPPAALVCCSNDGSQWKIAWMLAPRPL